MIRTLPSALVPNADHSPRPLRRSGPLVASDAISLRSRRLREHRLGRSSLRPGFSFPRRLTTRVVALLCVANLAVVTGAAVAAHPAGADHERPRQHGVRVRHRAVPRLDRGQAPQRADRRHGVDRRAARATGSSPNDGGVFAFNAPFFGSLGARHLNSPIVGMAATPTGKGYWLVAGDGGVFTFGDAKFYGSTGCDAPQLADQADHPGPGRQGLLAHGDRRRRVHVRLAPSSTARPARKRLNAPIVGMTATPTGRGYLLVASDGGVFTFGNAKFHGSTGSRHVNVAGRRDRGHLDRAAATGSRRGTAASSTSATPRSRAARSRLLSPLRQITQITSVPGNAGYRLLALPAPLMIAPPARAGLHRRRR